MAIKDGKIWDVNILNLEMSYYFGAFHRVLFFVLASLAFVTFNRYLRKREETGVSESLILETKIRLAQIENNYLRCQIKPHFLFNVLDHVYHDLALGESSGSEAVSALSQILRNHMNYSFSQVYSPLSTEIKNSEDLVDLYQLLNFHQLYIYLDYEEDEIANHQIPPFIIAELLSIIIDVSELRDANRPAILFVSADTVGIEISSDIHLKSTSSNQIETKLKLLVSTLPDEVLNIASLDVTLNSAKSLRFKIIIQKIHRLHLKDASEP